MSHYPVDAGRDDTLDEEKQMTTTINSAQIQILRHPNCPATLLDRHLNHRDVDVRSAIASNPALNEAQQNTLADDESVAVRLALLNNPALCASVMARLFEDSRLIEPEGLINALSFDAKIEEAKVKSALYAKAAEDLGPFNMATYLFSAISKSHDIQVDNLERCKKEAMAV